MYKNSYPKPEKREKKVCKVFGCKTKVKDDNKFCKMHTKALKVASKPKKKIASKSKTSSTGSRTKAKAAIQKFRRYESSDKNGVVKCVTCPIQRQWNKGMHGGHYIPSERTATCFDEMNIHPQCAGCNKFKMNDPVYILRYRQFLINEFGLKSVELLEIRSNKTKKYSKVEFQAIEKYYEDKFNRLWEERNRIK